MPGVPLVGVVQFRHPSAACEQPKDAAAMCRSLGVRYNSRHDPLRRLRKDEEYSWYVTYSNSSVHAGPFSVVKGPLGTAGDGGLFAVAAIACQAATLLTKELHINVSKENEAFMTQFSKDPCNWSPTT